MLLTITTFLIILSLLVFVHELGHFLVAKKTGIKVEEFGFGLPPKVASVKFGETVYSLNLLPIGGFVKLAGEDGESSFAKASEDKGKLFWAKPKKVRVAVILAGVLMNFLLAVLAFSFVYTKIGIPTKTNIVKVVGIAPSSPAEIAGIKEGDVVVSAGGVKIEKSETFMVQTQKFAGKEMNVEVRRKKDNLVFSLTPRVSPPEGEGPLGVVISDTEMKFYPFWQMPFRGMFEGFKEALGWAGLILAALGKMFWQLLTLGVVPKDVAGPIGIFQVTGNVAQGGLLAVLQFLGILSVNLALVNILPIPALDGGRLLFIGIETLTGRRVKAKVERWAHQIGMAFLLFLVLLVTINDISRILQNSGFIARFKSFLTF